MDWRITIESLALNFAAFPADDSAVIYDQATNSLVLTLKGLKEPLHLSTDEHSLVLDVRQIVMRLPEDVLRQLAEKLPPELLH